MKPFWKTPIRKWGIWKTIGRTAGGDNPTGQVLHGVLDLLPVPNQPIGKLIKAVFAGEWSKAKEEVGKLITVRNIVALAVATSIVTGWITLEDVKNFINIFHSINELINGI